MDLQVVNVSVTVYFIEQVSLKIVRNWSPVLSWILWRVTVNRYSSDHQVEGWWEGWREGLRGGERGWGEGLRV